MLGRFLAKVGLGIMATDEPDRARDQRFDQSRRYARFGDFKGLWPIFRYTQGQIDQLKRIDVVSPDGQELIEQADLYSYALLEVARRHTLFRFDTGMGH